MASKLLKILYMKKTLLSFLLLGLTTAAYAAELPFSEKFAGETTEFTFYDGNGDDNTLKHSKGNYNGADYDNCVTFIGDATAADDWLITPSFELKAGYVYEVTYKSKVTTGCTFSTAWFVSSTPDAPFAGEAVSTFTESDTNYSWPDRTFTFSVEQDGTYYLGMHLTGEQGQGTYYFDNFSMSAGVSTATPAAPVATEAVISLVDDKLSVKFDVTAPSVDVSGGDLRGDVTLKVTRSDNPELLFTQTVAPGAVWNFVDNEAAAALVTYSVVAVQSDLESEAAVVTANGTFVKPAAVKNFNVQHDGKGHFEFTWDPVTEGSGAGFFVPAEVRYSIMLGYAYIVQDIDGTTASYTYDLGSEPGQESVSFSIVATNSAGTSTATSSSSFLVGNPYTGEFAESFANYKYNTKTWTITEGNAWRVSSSYYIPPAVSPYDNDSGMLQASSSSSKSTIASPIINMEGVDNPMLKFYMWRQNGYYYSATLQVGFRYNGTDMMVSEQIPTKTDGDSGWEEVTIAVPEEVATGDFQILFTYDNGSYAAVVIIDNITIKSYPDYSMSLEAVEAPEVAEIGQQIDIVARLSNMGTKAAEAYSVTFSIDGEEYTTVSDVEAIAGMSEGSVVLPFTVAPKYAGTTITVEAVLNFDAEDSIDDNTASTTITVNENSLAEATDLDAVVNDDFTVTLTWTAPEVSDEPTVTVVTEDFESYEKGAIVGQNGWIFTGTDNESKRILGGSNSIYDAMIVQSYTQSYGTSFVPNSGDNAVAFGQGFNYSAVVNSWIISPEVAGNTPVSFYAIGFYPYGTSSTDPIQLLWSDGSTELEDFQLLQTYTVVGTSWTEFSATLPAEAKRFAIHFEGRMNNDNIAIDDITYSAYGEPAVLTGINVYRNDELIATLPADATTYNDTTVSEDATHYYYVTAVYDKGESMPSNTATVDVPSGVGSVVATGATVYTEGSQLVVTGADGKTVVVADVAGRVIATSVGDIRVTLTPGLYVVNLSGNTVKVAIR